MLLYGRTKQDANQSIYVSMKEMREFTTFARCVKNENFHNEVYEYINKNFVGENGYDDRLQCVTKHGRLMLIMLRLALK